MIDFKTATYLKLSKTDSAPVDLSPLMIPGEEIIGVYKSVRDFVAFTNKRIIAVNVQGITGKKKDFTSLPYSKIQVFSVETAGNFDLDSELDLVFSGLGHTKFEFTGASDIIQIGQTISQFVL